MRRAFALKMKRARAAAAGRRRRKNPPKRRHSARRVKRVRRVHRHRRRNPRPGFYIVALKRGGRTLFYKGGRKFSDAAAGAKRFATVARARTVARHMLRKYKAALRSYRLRIKQVG